MRRILEIYQEVPANARAVKVTQEIHEILIRRFKGEEIEPLTDCEEIDELISCLRERVFAKTPNAKLQVGDWLVIDSDGDLFVMDNEHFSKSFRKHNAEDTESLVVAPRLEAFLIEIEPKSPIRVWLTIGYRTPGKISCDEPFIDWTPVAANALKFADRESAEMMIPILAERTDWEMVVTGHTFDSGPTNGGEV